MIGVADEIAKSHLQRVKIKDDFIAAACPFHKGGNERKPSFWISRETGAWGCFTCSEGGSDLKVLLKNLGVNSRKIEAQIDEARKEAKESEVVRKVKAESKAKAEFKGRSVLPANHN